MNSILLVVMGMLLLTAELIPAAPAQFFDEDAQVDPGLNFQDLGLVKRSKAAHVQCLMKCMACSEYTTIPLTPCFNECQTPSSSPGKSRAYSACNTYLSRKK